MTKMGCRVLCLSVALLMICQHVQGQCTEPIFQANNVMLVNHLSSFPDGSTVTFECMIGYRPVVSKAPKSVTCQGNKWTDLKLTCTTLSGCTQPEVDLPIRQSFPGGSTVTFECKTGHRPVDPKASTSITCQRNQWTSLELSCTRKSCGRLANFDNGRYEMSGHLFGDTAKPVCDQGYNLADQETTRTCQDQGWDGKDPVCERVKCSAPPPIVNGQLEDDPLESYDYLQAVSYRCNRGYDLIGQSTLHCSEDGTFKPDPPRCFDGCPMPTIPNAKKIHGNSPPYKLDNFVEYRCKDGFTMKGDAYILCTANGWDPKPPRCIVNDAH